MEGINDSTINGLWELADDRLNRLGALSIYADEAASSITAVDEAYGAGVRSWEEVPQSDRDGLVHVMWSVVRVDEFVPTPDWAPNLADDRVYVNIDEAVTKYHDALPFSDAERRWLRGVLDELGNLDATYDDLAASSGQLVTLGRQQPVDGAALTERFWRWRFGRGPYSRFRGWPALVLARESLERIARFMPS